jgi:hypothetical protein
MSVSISMVVGEQEFSDDVPPGFPRGIAKKGHLKWGDVSHLLGGIKNRVRTLYLSRLLCSDHDDDGGK